MFVEASLASPSPTTPRVEVAIHLPPAVHEALRHPSAFPLHPPASSSLFSPSTKTSTALHLPPIACYLLYYSSLLYSLFTYRTINLLSQRYRRPKRGLSHVQWLTHRPFITASHRLPSAISFYTSIHQGFIDSRRRHAFHQAYHRHLHDCSHQLSCSTESDTVLRAGLQHDCQRHRQ